MTQDNVIVVVVVPSPEWAEIAANVWKRRHRRGGSDFEAVPGGVASTYHWAAWWADKPLRTSGLERAIDGFEQALCSGLSCVGFSPDVEWLPSDLVDAADHKLIIPKLTGADVAIIVERLVQTKPSLYVSDEQTAAVTPKLLRIARRQRNQRADDYIGRLLRLLERQATAKAATHQSPREAPTLERLHGLDDAVLWGENLCADLAAFKAGKLPWADIDRGCLLSGPPGCGKTMFARALATSCNVPLIAGSYGEWHSQGTAHQGDFLKAMVKAFASARASAPCILFIDEIDPFPDRGSVGNHNANYAIQVVNALLSEIDGIASGVGVILIGACNSAARLDPALTRSGRLDRHFRIQMPDRMAIMKIVREHLGNDLAAVDLSTIALEAAGSSGADCERFVRGARRRARMANRAMLPSDLTEEIRGKEQRSDAEMWMTAVHEAGHALAQSRLFPGSLNAVTLRAIGTSAGQTQSALPGSTLDASDIHLLLICMLAGRAAEEVVFGRPSSGSGGSAGSDLAQATSLAISAGTAFGLDDRLGLTWSGTPVASDISNLLARDPALAKSVNSRLQAAYAEAVALCRDDDRTLHVIARALLNRCVLDGADVDQIIEQGPNLASRPL